MNTQQIKSGMFIVLCVLCLSPVVYGQTGLESSTPPKNSPTLASGVADVQQTQEKLFILNDTLLKHLEHHLPTEKFVDITEEVKDKKISEAYFSHMLSQAGLTDDEIQTVMLDVRAYLELQAKVKEAAPVILSIVPMIAEIEQKGQTLETVTSDEEKSHITQNLAELHERFNTRDDLLKDITTGIRKTQLAQVSALLEGMGYTSEEIDTIVNGIQRQVLFAEKIGTLETIIQSIQALKQDIGTKEAEMEAAQTEDEKTLLAEDIVKLAARERQMELNFTGLITGIDVKTFYEKDARELVWEDEIKEIFSPIMKGLKDMTERPRMMERLRNEIATYEQELPHIRQATENITKLRRDVRKWGELATRLAKEEEFWKQQESEMLSKLEATQHKLTEQEQNKRSVSEGLNFFLQSFVRHRGKNLLLAVLAFLAIYIVFYSLRRMLMKFNPLHHFPKYAFAANVIDVFFYLFSFIAATGAMMMVLYSSGDWLILGIMIILFLGLIWAARDMLPLFGEQIKLLLGVGPVRKGERIIYNGLPWKVESIGVQSYFKNPLLTSNTVKLPLHDLIGMRSRRDDEREPWFPCQENDWVLLDDQTFGKVLLQTPEVVQIGRLGGSVKTYPTGTFLGMNPENLSGNFRIAHTFGIDYAHQTISTTEVPETMSRMLTEKLQEEGYGDNIVQIAVEFQEAGASSLDLAILADFSGGIAQHYPKLSRTLQRICVEICTQHGWNIPFPELTVHAPDFSVEK